MAHDEAHLMKLNKEKLVRTTLDYQGKIYGFSVDLKNDLSGLKSHFSKLEADIQVTRNVNTKLSERLVTMERRCYAILGGNVFEFRVFLQALLIMDLIQKFWKF